MIDLHTHSTASDGSLTPTELAALGRQKKLTALALTDHDTTDGLSEFLNAQAADSPILIPGIEISTFWYDADLHILGLLIDPDCKHLRTLTTNLVYAREKRLRTMLTRLHEMGIELSFAEVQTVAGTNLITRSHLALALHHRDLISEPQEAFRRYIGRGCPAYIPLERPPLAKVLDAIRNSGGLSFWAHPTGISRRTSTKMRQFCRQMREYGLDGLEAWYSHYSEEQHKAVRAVAMQCRMLMSGGSDFHGDASPGIELGIGKGNLIIPDSVYDDLLTARESKPVRKKF